MTNEASKTEETVTLTAEQARMIADTIAWNIDLDTVRYDNGDEARADFLVAFRDQHRKA